MELNYRFKMIEIGGLNWMLITCYFVCVLNPSYSQGMTRSRSRCEKIAVPMCHQNLFYSQTIFPNSLGHGTQEEAGYEVHAYNSLVKTQCSPALQPFLCALYVPVCNSALEIILPCRSLCELARSGCEHVWVSNDFGPWPPTFYCSSFPSWENDSCVTGNSVQNSQMLELGIVHAPSTTGNPPQIGSSAGITSSGHMMTLIIISIVYVIRKVNTQ